MNDAAETRQKLFVGGGGGRSRSIFAEELKLPPGGPISSAQERILLHARWLGRSETGLPQPYAAVKLCSNNKPYCDGRHNEINFQAKSQCGYNLSNVKIPAYLLSICVVPGFH